MWGLKKKGKKGFFLFFLTKYIHALEIMKCSKLKREAENFREKSMLDKYVTFKQTLEQIKITKKFGVGLLLVTDD